MNVVRIIFPNGKLSTLMGFPYFFLCHFECNRIARFLLIKTKNPNEYIATDSFLWFCLIRHAYVEGLAFGPRAGLVLYLLLSRKRGLEEGDMTHYRKNNFYKMLRKGADYQVSQLIDAIWIDVYSKRHRSPSDTQKILYECITREMGGKESFLNEIARVVKGLPKDAGFHFVTFDFRKWAHDINGAYDLIHDSVQRVKCFGAIEYTTEKTTVVPHMHFIFQAPNKYLLQRLQRQDIIVHQKASYANQPWPWRQFNAACYLMKDYLGRSKWSKGMPYPIITTFKKKKRKSPTKKEKT